MLRIYTWLETCLRCFDWLETYLGFRFKKMIEHDHAYNKMMDYGMEWDM